MKKKQSGKMTITFKEHLKARTICSVYKQGAKVVMSIVTFSMLLFRKQMNKIHYV